MRSKDKFQGARKISSSSAVGCRGRLGQDIRDEQRERRRNGEREVCEEYEEGGEQEWFDELELWRDVMNQGIGESLVGSSLILFTNILLSLL